MTIPIITASITFTFDLDEQGLFNMKPQFFDENDDFTASYADVKKWLESGSGQSRIKNYFAADVDAMVSDRDHYAMPWTISISCKHDWEAWLSNTSECVKCGARRDKLNV